MILSVLKKRPRNSSVELLRILSMTMIVMFHFCANAYRYNSADFVCGHDSETLIKLIFHALGQTGVPVFMFISGYYGIHFKKNRLIDIILQCFVYIFLFYMVAHIFYPNGIGGGKLLILSDFCISGQWFMHAYITIYLFSDSINATLDKLSIRSFSALILVMMYISVGLWVYKESALNMFTLLEIYAVARYVRRFLSDMWKARMVYLVFPSLLLFLLPVFYGWYAGNYSAIMPYVNKYYNPFILIFAICLVVSAERFYFYNKCINYLASSVLACYLIHTSFYFPPLVTSFFHFEKYNLGWILLLSLMIVVGCSLVDKLRLYIQNKFINL